MGCIYSKAIARSMSVRDELSDHGFRSSAVAWEELLSSHSGTDQLFALVRSATQRPSDMTLPSARDPDGKRDSGTFTRSRSYDQMTRESGHKLDWEYKSQTGSRSFHTVEEYDAMLERIQKFRTRSVQHFEDCNSPQDVVGDKSRTREPHGNNFEDLERVVQVDSSTRETGWKRKAAVKGLTPLDVPSIEFPAGIGRNERQLVDVEGEQIYSAETYVTPKFGSYNGRVYSRMQEGDGTGENPVFSRELLAAFEDCMQQLQEEEESIIWQIGADSLAEDENSKQSSHDR
ncbi:Unknown protein [Striga hermonthica]|uniref:Uncharacterized protein n=1 Tax=Striga hermonthica TaxID=68872 RepID=A0A9N7MVL7_STRHE|nr:Unknown protein [Striga hermonthica]